MSVYEDVNCDGLRDEWLRDIPVEWQKVLMDVEPRFRIIRGPKSGNYLIVLRQLPEERASLEKFEDGNMLWRWLPIRWLSGTGNVRWMANHLREAFGKYRERFGSDTPSPEKVRQVLDKEKAEQAAMLKKNSDDALKDATDEAIHDLGTQRVTSIAGVKPGMSYVNKESVLLLP